MDGAANASRETQNLRQPWPSDNRACRERSRLAFVTRPFTAEPVTASEEPDPAERSQVDSNNGCHDAEHPPGR